MQTPNLSAAQRSYMNDPEAFRRRMERRAEDLPFEGYGVLPGEGVGLFVVLTPNEEQHIVNVLTKDCSCPYQQKAEIPQVPCKHLLGLEGLIVEVLSRLKQFAEYGLPAFAEDRLQSYRLLFDHWQQTLEALQIRQAEEEEANAECATGCDAHAEF